MARYDPVLQSCYKSVCGLHVMSVSYIGAFVDYKFRYSAGMCQYSHTSLQYLSMS